MDHAKRRQPAQRMLLGLIAPGAASLTGDVVQAYVDIARMAEAARLDGLFVLGREADVDSGHELTLDPVMLMAALSSVTENIGLFAAADPTYDQPYNIARRIASIDQLSAGRAGWVLTLDPSQDHARNYGLAGLIPHDERHERAREFAQVVQGLWDSWDDDAFTMDVSSGRYFDPTKMHILGHKGRHFMVRGPLNVARSRQGRPVIAHDPVDQAGCDLAAAVAEIVRPAAQTLAEAQAIYADLKARAAGLGRDPASLKVMPRFALFGPPEAIADRLQAWFEAGAADGFCLEARSIGDAAAFAGEVVPEVRRRGVFPTHYDGPYLRHHLGLAIPPATLGGASALAVVE